MFASVFQSTHAPEQQPAGQVTASHTQVPLLLRQSSPGPHPAHCAAPVPHEVGSCDAHSSQLPVRPPMQQPFGHEFASHTHVPLVLSHSRFVLHAPHVAPAVPHELLFSDPQGSHVPVGPPLQQPLGHDFASHTHCPDALQSRLPQLPQV